MQINVEKAIQALGVVLRREGKHAGRLRLLKLLYIADRHSIERTGLPILGSKFVAMKHGPLHSEILDLMNGFHAKEPIWSSHFRSEGREIVLDSEPETGKLSRHEIEILNSVVDEHRELSDWELVDKTHGFQEWIKNYPNPTEDTSRRIILGDIIAAVGRNSDREHIFQDLKDSAEFDSYFSRLSK